MNTRINEASPRRPALSVLFVCMGNICRSPSAEGFLRAALDGAGLADLVRTDSAGTHGYHIGSPPDHRAIAMTRKYGVDISDLRARRVHDNDFHEFDLVLAMDEANLRQLSALKQGSGGKSELRLMMNFATSGGDEVPDPYYGGIEDFRLMCDLLDNATHGLLAELQERIRAHDPGI